MRKQNKTNFSQYCLTGFTLIELVIILAITALLTTIVVFNFSRLRSSEQLQSGVRSVVSRIREVQNFVLSGQSRPEGTPQAYEITFAANAQSYLIRYDVGGTLYTLETVGLTPQLRIGQVLVGGSPVTQAVVRLTSPYGQIFVDGTANQGIEIQILHANAGLAYPVLVDGISGRISVGSLISQVVVPPSQPPEEPPAEPPAQETDVAAFVRVDTTTKGNWKGSYGSEGYNIIEHATNYPSYAQVSLSGNSSWVWVATTYDNRALEKLPGPDRIASTWWNFTEFSIDLNLTDGQAHQVSLYNLDWDDNHRIQTIAISSATTGNLLDTRQVSGFLTGQYYVWNIKGHVNIKITINTGVNAVISGLFFDPMGVAFPPAMTTFQYYVATNGNDTNPGTEAQPWRTIQRAMTSATPGSTVYVKAGAYPERLVAGVSGTPGNYITFQPYGFSGAPNCGGNTGVQCGGDQVILDYSFLGTSTDGVPYLDIKDVKYIRIQGFAFQNYYVSGTYQRGVIISGSSEYVEIKHNKILNIQNLGRREDNVFIMTFWILSPANNVLVYANEIGGIISGVGEALTTVAANVTIEKNWIHDTDAIAIDIGQYSSGTVVRGNLLEYISWKRDGSGWWYNNPSTAIYVNGGTNAVIEKNVVRDGATAYQVTTEPTMPDSHHIVIRNNIAYRDLVGIHLGNFYSDTDGSNIYEVKVINNTLNDNYYGFSIRPYTSASVVWKNNIVTNNDHGIANDLNWPVGTMDYNLYYGNGALDGSLAVGPDTHKVTADPGFTNPAGGVFSIGSSSPAKNAGDPGTTTTEAGTTDFPGNSRIVSGQIDIGAYEVQ